MPCRVHASKRRCAVLARQPFCPSFSVPSIASSSSSPTSPSVSRHPRAPALAVAWAAFLAPGMGIPPLQMSQLSATWQPGWAPGGCDRQSRARNVSEAGAARWSTCAWPQQHLGDGRHSLGCMGKALSATAGVHVPSENRQRRLRRHCLARSPPDAHLRGRLAAVLPPQQLQSVNYGLDPVKAVVAKPPGALQWAGGESQASRRCKVQG